jgi:predicted DNA-binding transcriptional regulator AlpA
LWASLLSNSKNPSEASSKTLTAIKSPRETARIDRLWKEMGMTATTVSIAPVRWQDHLRRVDPLKDRTLRWPDILFVTGLTKSQVKEKIKRDEFPMPFRITDSGRSLGWHASEVEAWVASRDAQREVMKSIPIEVRPIFKNNLPTKPAKKAVRRS